MLVPWVATSQGFPRDDGQPDQLVTGLQWHGSSQILEQTVVSGAVWWLAGLGMSWASGLLLEKLLQWVITDNILIFLTASGWIVLRATARCNCINYVFCRSSKIRDLNYFSFPVSDAGWPEWRCTGEGTHTHLSCSLCEWKAWTWFAQAQNLQLQSFEAASEVEPLFLTASPALHPVLAGCTISSAELLFICLEQNLCCS